MGRAIKIIGYAGLAGDSGCKMCSAYEGACPCAACQGEPDAMGRVIRPHVEHGPKAFDLLKFELVGGYAIQLFWADGHASGIYAFTYLKKLADLPMG